IDGQVDMKHIYGLIVAKKKAMLGREDKSCTLANIKMNKLHVRSVDMYSSEFCIVSDMLSVVVILLLPEDKLKNNTRGFKFETFSNITARNFTETEVVHAVEAASNLRNSRRQQLWNWKVHKGIIAVGIRYKIFRSIDFGSLKGFSKTVDVAEA
nr:hypothetical protein [Tanacetum cinerariifolium]